MFITFVSFSVVADGCPELEAELRDKPEKVLPCLGLAIHQVRYARIAEGSTAKPLFKDLPKKTTRRSWSGVYLHGNMKRTVSEQEVGKQLVSH